MSFLSTWPIPRGGACLAAGTTATCTAQGFFLQITALCTPTYNVSLAIYYLLVIVKGWKETRVKKIEKYLHALPICLGFGTAFAALGLKLYKSAVFLCWIGIEYGISRLAFMYAEVWAMMIFLPICMSIIYFHVLKQERKLDKYSASFAQKKRKQSKKIRNQAFLYVGCVYMTWTFFTVRDGVLKSYIFINCFIRYRYHHLLTFIFNFNFTFVSMLMVSRSFVSCNLQG